MQPLPHGATPVPEWLECTCGCRRHPSSVWFVQSILGVVGWLVGPFVVGWLGPFVVERKEKWEMAQTVWYK
jgi:hypothetical protein